MGRMEPYRKLMNENSFPAATGRMLLGIIFAYSGVVKLLDLPTFQASVASFQFVDQSLIIHITRTIPILELLLALGIFIPSIYRSSAAGITALSVVFAVIYASAWARGITPTCGCFGNNPILQVTPPQGMIRAIAIAILASIFWITPNQKTNKN